MKYDLTLKLFGSVLGNIIKKDLPNKEALENIEKEYKAIMVRAKDIGNHNNLISSYALAAFFIAMNRINKVGADENIKILSKGMESSKLLKMLLGDSKGYFSEKKMAKRRQWSKETHKHIYENDWVVNVIEDDPNYDLGFDYLECGVCKLCKDENVPELAHYLCSLDYMLAKLIGLNLTRTKTLADGNDKCDFRYKK